MTVHMQREIENLKKHLLSLCALVEENVQRATRSVLRNNPELAQSAIEVDVEIDQKEIAIEEECLKILALYQPVAIDLRFVVAAIKINNDLERIGDLAVNIAERTLYLVEHKESEVPPELDVMAKCARSMLRKSLDSLVDTDPARAREVCADDDIVDALNRDIFVWLNDELSGRPEDSESLIHMLSVSRHLERIADLATNIAQDVVYMIEGIIVRHAAETPSRNMPSANLPDKTDS